MFAGRVPAADMLAQFRSAANPAFEPGGEASRPAADLARRGRHAAVLPRMSRQRDLTPSRSQLIGRALCSSALTQSALLSAKSTLYRASLRPSQQPVNCGARSAARDLFALAPHYR